MSYNFGIDIWLNGQVITLEPKQAIDDLTKSPISVALPANTHLSLGTIGSDLKGLQDELNSLLGLTEGDAIHFPTAEEMPSELQGVWKTLMGTEIVITDFDLEISATPRKVNHFVIGLSLRFPLNSDGKPQASLGPVGVTGVNFRFTKAGTADSKTDASAKDDEVEGGDSSSVKTDPKP